MTGGADLPEGSAWWRRGTPEVCALRSFGDADDAAEDIQ